MGRRLSKAKPMMGGEPQPMQFGPAGPLKGQAAVPGDKSISHRVLMLSAMAVGRSRNEGLSPGSDVHSTAAALRAMGARVDRRDGAWEVEGLGPGGLLPTRELTRCVKGK